ncbi:related to enoyl-coa hydratase protein 3 [Ustilago trichophora]|uniref:Related to enoyl-coa hydratase protein 3 n=1 Tax=Ustilago trichophora TaxID=86804 RepID=A0A5C3EMK0_9BASI|nr:related to enoyl-coa hydratase protein 3 [Ustilago trichophora]
MSTPTLTQTLANGKVKVYHVDLKPYDDALSPRLPSSTHQKAMVCVIDRPEVKNAVDRETASALHSAFVSFANDPALRVAILTGGSGTFCAGADLKSISQSSLLDSPNQAAKGTESNLLDADMDAVAPMGVTRLAMNKPVIAAVEGFAVAGGMELTLWADLRVASSDAAFGILCRLRGVPLIDGGTVRLPALIGGSRAADLALTGRLVSATEAHSIGLVNYVVPPSAEQGEQRGFSPVVEKSLRIAAGLAANPQTCMLNDRSSMMNAMYTGAEGDGEGEEHGEEGKVDLRLKGGLRKAMEKEFELGMQSLAKLLEEGQVGAFVNRSQQQREADRAKSRASRL